MSISYTLTYLCLILLHVNFFVRGNVSECGVICSSVYEGKSHTTTHHFKMHIQYIHTSCAGASLPAKTSGSVRSCSSCWILNGEQSSGNS